MSSKSLLASGTPLDAGELNRGKILFTAYTPKLRYPWNTDEAIGRCLEELKEGRLIARCCRKCERLMIPPGLPVSFSLKH